MTVRSPVDGRAQCHELIRRLMNTGNVSATPALRWRVLRLGATDRPELALRAGIILLAAFTVVVALAPNMHWHAVAPAVDLVLDTTAVIVSASLTALAWVRYRERREPIALFQASAFLTLAVAYSVAVLVSLSRDGDPGTLASPMSPQTWVFAMGRLLAAALLVVGGTTVRDQSRVPFGVGVLVGPAVLVGVVAARGLVFGGFSPAIALLALDVPPDALPRATALGAFVQVITASLCFEAAVVMRAMYRRDHAIMDAWLAVGLVFAGFAELHWLLYPSGHPGQVSTGDLLRLAYFVALLLGIEAEARAALKRLRFANQELAVLRVHEVDRAAVEERSRLARELHDGLAQDLWLAKLKAAQAARLPGLPSDAGPLLAATEAAIDNGLNEARQAVLALRLSSADDGFCALLSRYVDDFEDRFGLRVELRCDGDLTGVSPRTQAEVLRIAQEALTNARQHASATVVGMRLSVRDGRVSLRVLDNGRGFRPSATREGGFGLQSMRERAALIGGRLWIRSAPGKGTDVRLSAPVSFDLAKPLIGSEW